MDEAEIRRKRLQAYLDQKLGGVEAELARRIKRSPSQTSDMLAGRKAFGAKMARYVEKQLGMERYHLDHDDSAVAVPPTPTAALERSQEIGDVEISKSALELIRAWNALPLNERMAIKRKVELAALRYSEPVPDENLAGLAAPGTPTAELVAKKKVRSPGTQ
jgi:hypothetical protein